MVTRGRRAGPAVADRVAAAPAPGGQRRQGRAPHGAADQGLGPGVPRRPAVPARLGLARPPQARGTSPASPAGSGRSRGSATCSTSTGAAVTAGRTSATAEDPGAQGAAAERRRPDGEAAASRRAPRPATDPPLRGTLRPCSATDPASRSSSWTSRTTSPIPTGSLSVRGGADIVPIVNREIALARNNGAIVAYTPGLAPGAHAALRRRTAASGRHTASRDTWGAALHPDLEVPDDAPRHPQGRQRRGRLLRLHDAGPGDRARRSRPTLERAPARRRRDRRRGRGPGHRLLRQGDRRGRRPARLRHHGAHGRGRGRRPAAGRRRAGPGEMRDAGVLLHSTRMR